MAASDRRIVSESTGLTVCQCQIHGSLPILWHWENCESSRMRAKSKSGEMAEYALVNFARDAQRWIEMPSSSPDDAKQIEPSSRNA
jgi:hypothetical protein